MVADKTKTTAETKKANNTSAKKTQGSEVISKGSKTLEAQTDQKSSSQKVENASKSKMPMIRIKQIGSPIRRDPRQELYLKSLGLGKMNRVRQVVDTPATQGLLDKLRHMVVVVEQ